MNKKRYIYFSLMIAWMSIIFMFSNQQGESSASLSSQVIDLFLKMFYFPYREMDVQSQASIIESLQFVVRKIAHMSEYGLLWFFSYQWLRTYPFTIKKCYLLGIFICFAYASTDEFHQSMIPGRGPSFVDVLIDTSGSVLFGGIFLSLEKKFKKIKVNSK